MCYEKVLVGVLSNQAHKNSLKGTAIYLVKQPENTGSDFLYLIGKNNCHHVQMVENLAFFTDKYNKSIFSYSPLTDDEWSDVCWLAGKINTIEKGVEAYANRHRFPHSNHIAAMIRIDMKVLHNELYTIIENACKREEAKQAELAKREELKRQEAKVAEEQAKLNALKSSLTINIEHLTVNIGK